MPSTGDLEFLHLDFTDVVRNKVFTDPEAAARRLADPQGALLGAVARCADARLAFCGLAAIPIVVLAGHIVTDRRHVRLYDFQPEAGSWAWPGTADGFPPLNRSGLPKRAVREAGDAVIRMSVSYAVNAADTEGLELGARLQIDLSVPNPVRGVVRSEAQVREYGRVFRETLDQLRQGDARLPPGPSVLCRAHGPGIPCRSADFRKHPPVRGGLELQPQLRVGHRPRRRRFGRTVCGPARCQ